METAVKKGTQLPQDRREHPPMDTEKVGTRVAQHAANKERVLLAAVCQSRRLASSKGAGQLWLAAEGH